MKAGLQDAPDKGGDDRGNLVVAVHASEAEPERAFYTQIVAPAGEYLDRAIAALLMGAEVKGTRPEDVLAQIGAARHSPEWTLVADVMQDVGRTLIAAYVTGDSVAVAGSLDDKGSMIAAAAAILASLERHGIMLADITPHMDTARRAMEEDGPESVQ